MVVETVNQHPLYQKPGTIRNFRNEEVYKTIRSLCLEDGALYQDVNFNYPVTKDIEVRRTKAICDRPMFINGSPSRFDALQGQISDCWAICAMELLTLNQDLFKHVVPSDQDFESNYIGAFHFRIWQQGYWYDVVVDDLLPVYTYDRKTTVFAHSRSGNVFWAALLEKAYAKVCSVAADKRYYYGSLEEGNPITSFLDFTGGIVTYVRTYSPPSGMSIKYFMSTAYSRSALLSCAFNRPKDKDPIRVGLLPAHTYAITKLFACDDNDPDYPGLFLLRLMNPYGYFEWRGDWSDDNFELWKQIDARLRQKLNVESREDGEFWMNQNDFVDYFKALYVCHLGPSLYMDSITPVTVFDWRFVRLFGEWVKGSSAGGSDPSTRSMNTQYAVKLDWSEQNLDDKGCMVIDLISRSKEGRLIKPSIGFFVYLLDDDKQLPLDEDFFNYCQPVNPLYTNFSGHGIRSKTEFLKLKPGKYAIVPCTQKKDEESQFLLRIFTEFKKLETFEGETQIGLSNNSKTEKPSKYGCDERIRSIFNDYAKDQIEIDWFGLKCILKEAMSSDFGLVRWFFSIFRPILEWFKKLDDDTRFSKDDCRSMIAMLDENHSGKLDFSQFYSLWEKINFWTEAYERHLDDTGNLPLSQLREALSSIGYDVNKRTIHSISHVYANEEGKLLLRDFILSAVTIENVLGQRLKETTTESGTFTFTLEEWVKKTLML